MKRFRLKSVGLGLALAAGPAMASDGGPPPPVVGEVVPAAVPGLLPPGLRTPAPVDAGPIWLAAREQAAPPAVLPAGGAPEPAQPPRGYPGAATDPRTLPPIPVAPGASAPPARLPDPVRGPAVAAQPDAVPAPRPAGPGQAPMMTPPTPPPGAPATLPTPRPADPGRVWTEPARGPSELPCAPPDLMYPVGVRPPGKPGHFGSQPIRLSRDFPPLGDLIRHGQTDEVVVVADEHAAPAGGAYDRCFVRGEYLLWWMPGYAIPVLATTNADPTLNGFLGEPGTAALVGPGSFIDGTRSGFRIRAGAWLDDCGSCGIDAGFFFLGARSASATFGSDQFPLITRPVFVPNEPAGENGEAVAVPGILRGTLGVRGDSRLWGADVNLRKSLCSRCGVRAEVFAGYRHLNLRENLAITEAITVVGAGGDRLAVTDPVGTQVFVQDSFATRNFFHGGQVGGVYERRFGRWSLDARASVALGGTRQVLDINGAQVRQRPGEERQTFRGGLLAAGPNLGRFTQDRFSVVPEFTLNLGYWVTPSVRVYAGYNFLYWSNVVRPGDQIDRVVDLTNVPNAPPAPPSGQNRPAPLFKQSDLVINGIQFGLEWRW